MRTEIDVLASYARTALTDPGAMIDEDNQEVVGTMYAVDRLDDIIEILNPAEIDNAKAAKALTVLGRHIAEISDRLEDVEILPAVREGAAASLQVGLDHIDEAIEALTAEVTS